MILETGFSFGGLLNQILPQRFHSEISTPSHLQFQPGSDLYWMREALKVSLSSVGISNPNPAVGCVLVSANGEFLASGFTQAYGGKHAERNAFEKITDPSLLKDASVFVTLEPCSHTGKQPPCADLITSSPVRRVVIAREDPHPLVAGQGIQNLLAAGKQVEVGPLRSEASAWNFPFLASQHLNRPVVALKWAQTLDGQLADDSGTSQWISGPAARAYTHWLRQRYDAILVGMGTLISDFPRLSVRDCSPPHQNQPLPLILDPNGTGFNLDSSIQAKLNESLFTRPVVYITSDASMPKKSGSWLERNPFVTFLKLPGNDLISELISGLENSEISSLLGHPLQSFLVEGGPKTLTSFLKAGYADLLHVVTSPLITGGNRYRIETGTLLKNALKYELKSQFRLGQDSVSELVPKNLNPHVF